MSESQFDLPPLPWVSLPQPANMLTEVDETEEALVS